MAWNKGAFKFFAQKALPTVFDESLSYYELLCKVIDYLNDTINEVNNLSVDVDAANAFVAHGQGQIDAMIEQGNANITSMIAGGNAAIQQAIADLTEYRDNYFEHLDVQEEVNTKLDEYVANGTLLSLFSPSVSAEVTSWLDSHVTPTSPVVDSSLTIAGAAADAKVTGDKIANLNSSLVQNTGMEAIEVTNPGQYLALNTSTVDISNSYISAGYNLSIVTASPGDIFTVNTTGGNVARGWAFVDNNTPNNILDVASATIDPISVVLTAPDGTAYLVINNTSDTISYKGTYLKNRVSDLETKTANIETDIPDLKESVNIIIPREINQLKKFIVWCWICKR